MMKFHFFSSKISYFIHEIKIKNKKTVWRVPQVLKRHCCDYIKDTIVSHYWIIDLSFIWYSIIADITKYLLKPNKNFSDFFLIIKGVFWWKYLFDQIDRSQFHNIIAYIFLLVNVSYKVKS